MEKEAANFVFGLLNGDEWWQITLSVTVVISVVVGLLTWAFRSILKTIEMSTNTAINNFTRGHLAAQEESKDYSLQVFKNPNIRYLLRSIRCELQADRVTVYQYHNGEKSIANNPFLKVSCTHEVLGKDAISVIDYMKDKQVDIFDGITTKMFKGEVYGQVFVSDLRKDEDSRTLAQTLSRLGTTSIYMFPLKTPLGKVFGFGAVEYCCDPIKLDGQWVDWIGEKYNQVGALLAVEDLVKAHELSELRKEERGGEEDV